MDNTEIFRIVRNQLRETHDIHNTQIRLFQLAKDSTLTLSPGQRGALNFYSSLSHVDEETLDKFLNDLATYESSQPPLMTKSFETYKSLTLEPVVRQIKQHHYQWGLDANEQDNNQNHTSVTQPLLFVDTTLYKTPTDAQSKADQFLESLANGDEKTWIRWGIVKWAQQKSEQLSPSPVLPCQAELLHVQNQNYIIITNHLSEPFSKECQEQKTVHYTSKILNMEPLVHPAWITRGFIPHFSSKHGSFYILFKINVQPQDTLVSLSRQLSRILC